MSIRPLFLRRESAKSNFYHEWRASTKIIYVEIIWGLPLASSYAIAIYIKEC